MVMYISQIFSIIVDIVILIMFVVVVFTMPVKWKLWPNESKTILIIMIVYYLFSIATNLMVNNIHLRLQIVGIFTVMMLIIITTILILFYRKHKRIMKMGLKEE